MPAGAHKFESNPISVGCPDHFFTQYNSSNMFGSFQIVMHTIIVTRMHLQFCSTSQVCDSSESESGATSYSQLTHVELQTSSHLDAWWFNIIFPESFGHFVVLQRASLYEWPHWTMTKFMFFHWNYGRSAGQFSGGFFKMGIGFQNLLIIILWAAHCTYKFCDFS